MNPFIRRHLSYTNVAATLALVFAMSGGALAASHYLVNSTKQINPKVLKKLKGRTGKTGPTGPQGAKGPKGANGAKGAGGAKGAAGPPGEKGLIGPVGLPGSAGTARAYALVIPHGTGTPTVIEAKNVTGATRIAAGTYCVGINNPASGINTSTVRPLVTVNVHYSETADVGLFAYDLGIEDTFSCGGGFEVLTGHQKTAGALPVRDDEVAFNVAVP